MPRRLLKESGPIRLTLEQNDAWLSLFVASERNAIVRRSLERAMYDWRYEHLDKRADKKHVLGPPWNYELDKQSPLVATHKMVGVSWWTGRAKATATRNNTRGNLSAPPGHPLLPETARVIYGTPLPRAEMQFVADRFAFYLQQEFAGSLGEVRSRRGRPPSANRMRLTNRSRRRLGLAPRRRRRRSR